jgi:hypothetical protein
LAIPPLKEALCLETNEKTTKSQLTWRNLLNTKEESKRTVTVNISFDQVIDEEEIKLYIFNALSKHAQNSYLDTNLDVNLAKPTVIKVE